MTVRRDHRGICCLIALILAGVGPIGCAGAFKGPTGGVRFAPNGKTIAFLWDEGTMQAWVDGDLLTRRTYLLWSEASHLADLRSVQIASTRGEPANGPVCEWRFSPDSLQVAAIVPSARRIVLVDLASGKQRVLTDNAESITSFAWLAANEIGYVVHRASDGNRYNRCFCRQRLDASGEQRVSVLTERWLGYWSPEPQEYWSPSGKHVLFIGQAEGQLTTLSMASGTTRTVGAKNVILRGASWHPDGSQVFCILQEKGNPANSSALMIDVESGDVQDLSGHFRSEFPDVPPVLEPLWSADGMFVLANDSKKGAVLIRPHHWGVVWLGERAISKLGEPIGDRPPWLFRLPMPGWVGLQTPRALYASTYGASDVRMLLRASDWWAFSPDGTLVATLGREKKLQMQDLGEWWLLNAAESDRAKRAMNTTQAR